jgi:hypothetical protein
MTKNEYDRLWRYLDLSNPYPVDVFPDGPGKAARIGYEACIHNFREWYLREQRTKGEAK